MTRLGYDATDPASVPTDGQIYLGYVDGNYLSYNALRARFPGRLVVGIAVFTGTNAGLVFDGPPDNGTWDGVVDWVLMRRRAGVDPTVYTDADQWPTGRGAFASRGVAQPHWWIADWDNQVSIPAGAIGHQYRATPGYDVNIFADYWPGVDPPPQTTPPPPPTSNPPTSTPTMSGLREQDMMLVSTTGDPLGIGDKGATIFLLAGSTWGHIPAPADEQAWLGAGLPVASISHAQYAVLVSMLGQPAH